MIIEFWKTGSLRSPIKEEISDMKNADAQQILLDRLSLIEQYDYSQLIKSQILDPITGYKPLLESRVRYKNLRFRFLCAVKENSCWIVHLIRKDYRRLKPRDLKTALNRAKICIGD